MKTHDIHLADLVAFVRAPDLPPSLRPFVKDSEDEGGLEKIQVILKIRGTVDSYYATTVESGTTLEIVERRIHKDIGVVRLAPESKARLKGLLEKLQKGEFAHYLGHEIDRTKYPYRH